MKYPESAEKVKKAKGKFSNRFCSDFIGVDPRQWHKWTAGEARPTKKQYVDKIEELSRLSPRVVK